MPPRTAFGTFFSGLSTASALAHADSRPRKAHNVMAMEFVAASPNGMLLTFQFATYISAEKYAQPTVLITSTGAITPHTVKLDTRPVILAPPKFNTVASHNVKIV